MEIKQMSFVVTIYVFSWSPLKDSKVDITAHIKADLPAKLLSGATQVKWSVQ